MCGNENQQWPSSSPGPKRKCPEHDKMPSRMHMEKHLKYSRTLLQIEPLALGVSGRGGVIDMRQAEKSDFAIIAARVIAEKPLKFPVALPASCLESGADVFGKCVSAAGSRYFKSDGLRHTHNDLFQSEMETASKGVANEIRGMRRHNRETGKTYAQWEGKKQNGLPLQVEQLSPEASALTTV
ncbi:hypothetical protein Q9966_000655 [Columba livia]|nr:hypothetical protein Q9966_000655 [Columba livia]